MSSADQARKAISGLTAAEAATRLDAVQGANYRATEKAWPRALSFLATHLK
jgi:hypothetical protein